MAGAESEALELDYGDMFLATTEPAPAIVPPVTAIPAVSTEISTKVPPPEVSSTASAIAPPRPSRFSVPEAPSRPSSSVHGNRDVPVPYGRDDGLQREPPGRNYDRRRWDDDGRDAGLHAYSSRSRDDTNRYDDSRRPYYDGYDRDRYESRSRFDAPREAGPTARYDGPPRDAYHARPVDVRAVVIPDVRDQPPQRFSVLEDVRHAVAPPAAPPPPVDDFITPPWRTATNRVAASRPVQPPAPSASLAFVAVPAPTHEADDDMLLPVPVVSPLKSVAAILAPAAKEPKPEAAASKSHRSRSAGKGDKHSSKDSSSKKKVQDFDAKINACVKHVLYSFYIPRLRPKQDVLAHPQAAGLLRTKEEFKSHAHKIVKLVRHTCATKCADATKPMYSRTTHGNYIKKYIRDYMSKRDAAKRASRAAAAAAAGQTSSPVDDAVMEDAAGAEGTGEGDDTPADALSVSDGAHDADDDESDAAGGES